LQSLAKAQTQGHLSILVGAVDVALLLDTAVGAPRRFPEARSIALSNASDIALCCDHSELPFQNNLKRLYGGERLFVGFRFG
jgi:hypothetical protein